MRNGTTAGLATALLAGAILALGQAASAQTVPPAGFEPDTAELFQPVPDLGSFLGVHDAPPLRAGQYSFSLIGDYATDALNARTFSAGESDTEPVVDSLGTIHLLGAAGLLDGVQIGLRVPIHTTDESGVFVGTRRFDDSATTIGDVELNGKLRLMERSDDVSRTGLSVVPTIGLPTGSLDDFAGTGEISWGGLIALDHQTGPWHLGANFGGLVRDSVGGRGGGDTLEDLFRWGIALNRKVFTTSSLILEMYGATDAGSPFDGQFRSPVEILGAARVPVGPVEITFGLGGGVNDGKNAPQFRILGGVRPRAEAAAAPEAPARLSESRIRYVVEDHDRNGQVSPGDVIVYTITVRNTGDGTARDIELRNPVPPHTRYVENSITLDEQPLPDETGYVSAEPARVEVEIPELPAEPGRNETNISFKARIDETLTSPVTITNRALVSARGPVQLTLDVETAVFPAEAEAERVVRTEDRLELTEKIRFALNEATIDPSSHAVLDDVVKVLQAHPEIRVAIIGHTDSLGSDDYNLQLSQKRADSVKDYLVGKGIDPARLEAIGRGESQPVASNATERGRATNRRVEFRIR